MTLPAHRYWAVVGTATVLSLALLACSSLSPGRTQPLIPSAAPTASHPGVGGCALTPDASPTATIEISHRTFSAAATVSAGEAVAFVNQDNTAHTITEGAGGHADDGACVRKRVAARLSTVVTFLLPGDYPITCTIHGSMQTTVHVR